MLRRIALILPLLFSSVFAGALEVHVGSPGTLPQLITDDTDLKVSGLINGDDLLAIASCMPSLRQLDLSQAVIVAGDGSTVAAIPDACFAGAKLSHIVFPAQSAFAIGQAAFLGSGLQSLSLPFGVTSVGMGSFAACPDLKQVSIHGNPLMSSHTFSGDTALTSVVIDGLISLPEAAFSKCAALTDISGSESLVAIGGEAFSGCTSLSSFSFGDGLLSIGSQAFSATALQTADLSACSHLHTISPWVFSRCTSLRQLILPHGLGTVGEGALSGCTSVARLGLPASLQSIQSVAMSGMDTLSLIDASALSDVPELGEDVWAAIDPSAVTLIADAATVPSFEAAGQWRDFNIVALSSTTNTDDITAIAVPEVVYDGSMLHVSSPGRKIAAISLCGIDGRLLAEPCRCGGYSADIPTLGRFPAFLIIDITFYNGQHFVSKIRNNRI